MSHRAKADPYLDFITAKFSRHAPCGIPDPGPMPESLFPFQRDLCRVALQRGRCALFTNTGTGKSSVEQAWADRVVRHTGKPVLILAPLAVAAQTVREGDARGIASRHVRDGSEVDGPGIYVTNYDRMHRFDPTVFGGVVIDEGSRIKASDGATTKLLTDAFAATPFRLSATATPAPNDFTELGQQAEFLGIRTREEMLAEFFIHDGGSTQDWRLKGHATKAFWEWVASWALVLRKPSDLGYDDGGFDLPPLNTHERIISLGTSHAFAGGTLFVEAAQSLSDQRAIRRASIADRVALAVELVAAEPNEPWVIWGELNDECDLAEKLILGAAQIAGKDSAEDKEQRLEDFAAGRTRVMVSKAGICGAGLNWQHCARMIFLGASHSYEQVFQATRRIWRFGQRRPVDVYFIATDADRAILENLKRKEREAQQLSDEGAAHLVALTRASVTATHNEKAAYVAKARMRIPQWFKTETEEVSA